MRPIAIFVLALAALPMTSLLVGCAAPTDDESTSESSDLTKKTAPKAGMGAVTLEKPSWYDPAVFKGEVRLHAEAVKADFNGSVSGGQKLSAGAQGDFNPGSYEALFVPDSLVLSGNRSRGYGLVGLSGGTVNVTAGAVSTVKPAGLQVTTDRAIVWNTPVELASITTSGTTIRGLQAGKVITPGASDLEVVATLSTASRNASQLLPAATYMLDGIVGKQTVVLEGGKLTKLPVLKTSTFAVHLDPIDAAFPDFDPSCVTIEALGVKEGVRNLASFESAVLPSAIPVAVKAFGIDVPSKVVGSAKHFTLNRLELDDVVVSNGAGSSKVRGQATIEVKSASGVWSGIDCAGHAAFTTGHGVDLPDGSYRVTSTAAGVSNVEEISFP